jgi:hypothetical protein
VAIDSVVHRAVMTSFVERGYPPTADEIARALGHPTEAVEAALYRLHAAHGLVLQPGSTEIWLAHPFSASPTSVWVDGDSRGFWAPCLWCASGIIELACGGTATVRTRFAGEAEDARIRFGGGILTSEDVLVHFAIPPHQAWRNVVHFCASVLPFRTQKDAWAWCHRHRYRRGALVPIQQVYALGRAWYGRHLDDNFAKWSLAEAQAIFDQVGLSGEFWRLPYSTDRF